MPSTSITTLFDNLTTATLVERRKELTEQAFKVVPLLNWLRTKGRVVEVSGTYQIQVPLLYGNNTTLSGSIRVVSFLWLTAILQLWHTLTGGMLVCP